MIGFTANYGVRKKIKTLLALLSQIQKYCVYNRRHTAYCTDVVNYALVPFKGPRASLLWLLLGVLGLLTS